MSRAKPKKSSNDREDFLDSDTSLDKYYHDNNLLSSSSTSSSSTSSPSLEPRKMFIKKPGAKRNSFSFDDELPARSFDDRDPWTSDRPSRQLESRRPSNPLAKPDIQVSLVADCLGSTMPAEQKKDETPFSTMKLGSDTLDEEQEKAEFFRHMEQQKGEKTVDYRILNKQIEIDLSPTRPIPDEPKLIESFERTTHQMSTPLHHEVNRNPVQESLSNELDRELEHDNHAFNATTTMKHVTIVEPPVRPSASVDDFTRTGKTNSDFQSTNSDLGQLHIAYRQTISGSGMTNTRPLKAPLADPKEKKPAVSTVKPISKSILQTPTKKASSSVTVTVTRPKTAPSPSPKEPIQKDSALVEQLTLEKELLASKLQSLEEKHAEQLRQIRQDNYVLQAQISSQTDGKKETIPPKQRELSEVEKLLDGSQVENEKLCKQIKQIEQQHKQLEQTMFAENEKLRQELVQAKMLIEQYENSRQITAREKSGSMPSSTSENQLLKEEIDRLRQQLTNATNRPEQNLPDQRRIKDLERQVKELELINRRHQHHSTSQVSSVLNPSDDRAQLEVKLNKTEQTLREREAQLDKLLHEKHPDVTVNVLNGDDRIAGHRHGLSIDPSEGVVSRNKQLSGLVQLRKENERLKAELDKAQTMKPVKSLKRDLETIRLLRADLERKNDELEKLRALYDATTVQHKSLLAERDREKTRLAILGHKPYQPDRFSQSLQPTDAENAQLKHLVDKLEQDSQQQHLELMQLKADRQAAVNTVIRDKDEEIARLRQQHKNELQTIITEMSTNNSEIRSSDLLMKIESHETTIAHLQKRLATADEHARELAVLRVHDDELKSSVVRLEQELTDAQAYQTPEMKHFQGLQKQISQLEQRWQKRDQISKDYAASLLKQHEAETNNDVQKLRAIIQQKNKEIERFHLELDSMLQLLKTLKLQQFLHHS